MKSTSMLLAGLLSLALAAPALADDAHHPDQAKPAAAQAPKPAPEQTVKKMQGNVNKMQAQLQRLSKARNDAEVRKIMAEHMQTMEENMMLAGGMAGMDCAAMHGGQGMHGMGNHPMMGGGTGGMGMMDGMAAQHEAMARRMEQVEKRLEALEQAARPSR